MGHGGVLKVIQRVVPVSADVSGRARGRIPAWGQADTELSQHTPCHAIFVETLINVPQPPTANGLTPAITKTQSC